jgi:hypothetical protein
MKKEWAVACSFFLNGDSDDRIDPDIGIWSAVVFVVDAARVGGDALMPLATGGDQCRRGFLAMFGLRGTIIAGPGAGAPAVFAATLSDRRKIAASQHNFP